MNTTLEIEKNFFSSTCSGCYKLNQQLTPGQLSDLADFFIRDLFLKQLLPGLRLKNIKGRDRGEQINEQRELAPPPEANEILFIAGNSFIPEKPNTDTEKMAQQEFSLTALTDFMEFEGSSGIIFRINEQRTGALPDFVKLPDLGRVFPLKITKLRLGFQFYYSHYYWMLGLNPQHQETLLIEATPEKLEIKISSRKLKTLKSLPLERSIALNILREGLIKIFNFDLFSDYLCLASNETKNYA